MINQTITIENNSAAVFTVTDITFTTPLGITHSADLTNLTSGTSNFTDTTFVTVTTMTAGEIKTFTLSYDYVNTSTGVYTGSVFINCTESLSKTVNTEINVFTSGTVAVTADTVFVQQVLPQGTILMWSGSIATIPVGWNLCDGSNGTPDLRNEFIIAAYSDNAGVASTTITGSPETTGGTKDEVVVQHTHSVIEPNSGQGHKHTLPWNYGIDGAGGQYWIGAGSTVVDYTLSTTTNITVDSSGVSGTNANLPPYYALAFIMKVSDQENTYIL
jgi:hypothetical protein